MSEVGSHVSQSGFQTYDPVVVKIHMGNVVVDLLDMVGNISIRNNYNIFCLFISDGTANKNSNYFILFDSTVLCDY